MPLGFLTRQLFEGNCILNTVLIPCLRPLKIYPWYEQTIDLFAHLSILASRYGAFSSTLNHEKTPDRNS
jgi:hypothetical protein